MSFFVTMKGCRNHETTVESLAFLCGIFACSLCILLYGSLFMLYQAGSERENVGI